MSSCGHEWNPIPERSARYRCKRCGALGYRKLVMGLMVQHNEQMLVYLCDVKVKKKPCGEPAIVRSPRQLCREHYDKIVGEVKS
jgi:hypothetical protein